MSFNNFGLIQIFLGSESIIKNLKKQQTHTFMRKGSLFLELHLSFLQVTYLANAHTYDIYLFHMRILIAHKEITQYLVTFTLSVVNTSTQTYTHYEKYSNLKYISETTILPLIIIEEKKHMEVRKLHQGNKTKTGTFFLTMYGD